MGELPQTTGEKEELTLIDAVNAKLKELGSTAKWKRLPERAAGTEILKDKTVLMLDDSRGVLEAFVPDLMIATDGKAIFIQYVAQSVLELVDQIIASGANIVLLDYHLTSDYDGLKGSKIAFQLSYKKFPGVVVGFSSDEYAAADFKRNGAMGSVTKESGNPEESVVALAKLLAK